MSNQWFVGRNGKEQGPFSSQQLKSLAAAGKIQPSDDVRRDDMKGYVKAQSIKQLFPVAEQPPVAVPLLPVDVISPPAAMCAPVVGQAIVTKRKWIYLNRIVGSTGMLVIIFGLIAAAYAEFSGHFYSGDLAIMLSAPFSPERNEAAFNFSQAGALLGVVFGPVWGMVSARKTIERMEKG